VIQIVWSDTACVDHFVSFSTKQDKGKNELTLHLIGNGTSVQNLTGGLGLHIRKQADTVQHLLASYVPSVVSNFHIHRPCLCNMVWEEKNATGQCSSSNRQIS
jgi:hypothetical protein